MATNKPQKLGVPVNSQAFVVTDDSPDDYIGDRYIQPGAAAAAAAPEETSALRRVVGDTGISLLKGAIGWPEAVVGLADIATGGRAGKTLESVGFRPAEAKAFLDEQYSPAQKEAFKRVQGAANPDDPFLKRVGSVGLAAISNPSTIAHAVGESLPLMAAGGVVGRGVLAAATRMAPGAGTAAKIAAAGIGEGVVAAGSSAEQIRQQTPGGNLTGMQSLVAAGSGVLTAGLGMVVAKAAKSLGVGDIDTLLVGGKHVAPELQKSFTRRVLEGALTEGVLEELPQAVQEQAAQNYALGKPLEEGIDQALVMGMLSGSAMGAGAQLIRPGVPNVGPLSRAANEAIAVAPTAPSASLAPTAPDAPTAPIALTPEQGAELATHANERLAELQAKQKGSKTEDGTETLPAMLDPQESGELELLQAAGGDVQALARAYRPVAPAAPIDDDAAMGRIEQGFEREQRQALFQARAIGDNAPLSVAKAPAQDAPDLDFPHETDIVHPTTGKPFTVRIAAQHEMARQPEPQQLAIAQVQGGYVLRHLADANVPAAPVVPVEAPAKPAAAGNVSTPAPASAAVEPPPADNRQAAIGEVLDSDVLNREGVPFKVEHAARLRSQQDDGSVVQVPGGWVVRPQPPTAADIATAAEEKGRAGSVAADLEAMRNQDRGYRVSDDVRGAIQRAGLSASDVFKDTTWHTTVADQRGDLSVDIDPATDTATVTGEYMGTTVFTRSAKGGAAIGAALDEARAGLEEGERRRKAAKAPKLAEPAPAALAAPDAPPAAVDAPTLIEHVTSKGKTIRGVVRSDLTQDEAISIDSGTFKKNGGYFIRERSLDKLAAHDATKAGTPAAPTANEPTGTPAEAPPAPENVVVQPAPTAAHESVLEPFRDPTPVAAATAAPQSVEPAPVATAAPPLPPESKPATAAERWDAATPDQRKAYAVAAGVSDKTTSKSFASLVAPVRNRLAPAIERAAVQGADAGAASTSDPPAASDAAPTGPVKPEGVVARRKRVAAEAAAAQASNDAQPEAARKSVPQRHAERLAAETAFFTPGNVVPSYGGFDEVLGLKRDADGGFSVNVHEVKKIDGQWVRVGKPLDARWHSTSPGARELAAGPVARLDHAASAKVPYSLSRGDGNAFPNAPDRGIAPEAAGPAIKENGATPPTEETPPAAAIADPQSNEPPQKKPQLAAASPAKPASKIEDFGEKLEGARKDYATRMSDAQAADVSAVPLSESWPEPNYAKLLTAGADPFVVAWIHAARDEIPTKPQVSWKLSGWVASVKALREVSTELLDGSISRAQMQAQLQQPDFARVRDEVGGRADLYEAAGHEHSLRGLRLRSGAYSMFEGKEYRPAKNFWSVERQSKASAFGNWPRQLVHAETREGAIAAFKEKLATLDLGKKKPTSFVIWRKDGKFSVGKKIGSDYAALKTFNAVKEARAYLTENAAELEAALERYKTTPFERREENAPRVGADHRNGAKVTPEVFNDTFDFRGVQFGNYVEDSRRQRDLNDAYDALMDLAAVLGVPPKALSLNGQLGLAFGARGQGGKQAAAAHYESDRAVINLTKGAGAGSLAHEWFHATDNYFAKIDGGPGGYMTAAARNAGVRPEMAQAFVAVMQAIKSTQIRKRSIELDKRRSKPYWATDLELAARSFEAYVIAKLQDQGASNDYLANVVSEQFWGASEALSGRDEPTYPYPTDAEMGPIREAFDGFFQAVEVRVDEEGRAALFSRQVGSAPTPSEANALAALAQSDDLFALPKSAADTIAGIAADIDPQIKVRESSRSGTRADYTLTMPDGKTARVVIREPNPYGPDVYGFDTVKGENRNMQTERPGDNPDDARATGDVWIDASLLTSGSGGNKVYAIAATYSHNTGRIFIGDPAGLSDEALVRRPEQMLSSALKFGTTDHLAPHPRQVQGDAALGVPPLQWVYGDSLGNIRRLIDLNLAVQENGGDAGAITFNPDSGQFFDTGGQTLSRADIGLLASATNLGRVRGAGSRTLARSAVLRALLREKSREGAAGGQRDNLLARLARLGSDAPKAVGGLFTRGDAAAQSRGGQSATRVQSLVSAITSRWANAPEVVVVQSINDLMVPEAVRKEAAALARSPRSQGTAAGAPEGFFHPADGKVYLIADKLSGDADTLRVLLHESLGHFGLRGVFGEELGTILDRMAALNAGKVRQSAERLGYDFDKQDERRLAAEETLAEMAQTTPELGWVQQALAAIRGWLRDHVPGFGRMGLSDAELIRDYILPARGFVKAGGARAAGNVSTGTPFSRGLGDALTAGVNVVRDVRLPAGYMVGDLIGSVPGRLGLWHRTVGTKYNLAQRSAPFKRVFDSVQGFLNDVSHYAAESADLAPRMLPKLDSWRDITKSPLSPEDTKAVSAPIFQGTLSWARDSRGRAQPLAKLEEEMGITSLDDKARQLLRAGHVTAEVLRMWRGLPMEKYETIIEGKFEREFLKGGVVFTPDELRQHFKLTDAQISLYQEFRAALDSSLTQLAVSDMLRMSKEADGIREEVMATRDIDGALKLLTAKYGALIEADPKKAGEHNAHLAKLIEKADKAKDLMDRGYAPLSRFGQYTLDVVDADGNRLYFGLFESTIERSKRARELQAEFPAAKASMGTISQEAYKLFAGVSPETLELFGEMLGLESGDANGEMRQAFDSYIKLAKSTRSSMKRLIQRKGIAGFSEDAGRVLAGFVYSNARQTAGNLHMGEMDRAITEIPKGEGQLTDEAVRLREYIKSPQEESQALRATLFAQYLGGSVASAMVNATQPFTVTFPYLSQFGGIKAAARQMAAAVRDATRKSTGDSALDAALAKAEADGIVSPQEVHALQAQAMGKAQLKAGDGTAAGNALAKAGNASNKLALAWGKVFGVAEQFNRRTTFIAAYRTAVEQGAGNPHAFAVKAVNETQFIYNKGNKPQFARGAVGSVLFTFKQYSVNYVEMLHRMATTGEPGSAERAAGQKAALLALAVLFLMSGADGVPFVEDVQDVIDGALQRMGYNFGSRQRMKEFLAMQLGKDVADFVMSGVSGIPGMPIDVSGRLGMGNLIPGTGLFQKKTDHSRDMLELAGPVGDYGKRVGQSLEQLVKGDVAGAAKTYSPVAARNLEKAWDMATSGSYRDDRGYKIIDTTPGEAAAKAIGFQPRSVAQVQEATREVQRQKGTYTLVAAEIRSKMAKAIYDNDAKLLQEARDDLGDWNRQNPTQPMKTNMPAVMQRVREMRKTKQQRVAESAPKGIRERARAQLAEELN